MAASAGAKAACVVSGSFFFYAFLGPNMGVPFHRLYDVPKTPDVADGDLLRVKSSAFDADGLTLEKYAMMQAATAADPMALMKVPHNKEWAPPHSKH
jgi:hypothetical protein